jgi:hypothetical protein
LEKFENNKPFQFLSRWFFPGEIYSCCDPIRTLEKIHLSGTPIPPCERDARTVLKLQSLYDADKETPVIGAVLKRLLDAAKTRPLAQRDVRREPDKAYWVNYSSDSWISGGPHEWQKELITEKFYAAKCDLQRFENLVAEEFMTYGNVNNGPNLKEVSKSPVSALPPVVPPPVFDFQNKQVGLTVPLSINRGNRADKGKGRVSEVSKDNPTYAIDLSKPQSTGHLQIVRPKGAPTSSGFKETPGASSSRNPKNRPLKIQRYKKPQVPYPLVPPINAAELPIAPPPTEPAQYVSINVTDDILDKLLSGELPVSKP